MLSLHDPIPSSAKDVDKGDDDVHNDNQRKTFFGRAKATVTHWMLRLLKVDQRKLVQQRGLFLVDELAQRAHAQKGYATVTLPFSFLPTFLIGKIKRITVVTRVDLVRRLGAYGITKKTWDKDARVPYNITNIVMRGSNLISTHDTTIHAQRTAMKQVMHGIDLKAVAKAFQVWGSRAASRGSFAPIDLESSLKKVIVRMLGKTLLGMRVMPPDDKSAVSFDRFLYVLDKLDAAMTLFDISQMKKWEAKMLPLSLWLYAQNKQTLLSDESIVPQLTHRKQGVNWACSFLVTPNITKLLYISVIFFATHPQWQTTLRRALASKKGEMLDCLYKELCRHYIVTNLPRYASKPIQLHDNDKTTMPGGTMYYLLGRFIRMDPAIYKTPEAFNPWRFKDNPKAMNSVELCPFGLGPRQCPASGRFTKMIWETVMRAIFVEFRVSCDSQVSMERIPVHARHIALQKKYYATVQTRQ